jgi:hypothetical protein
LNVYGSQPFYTYITYPLDLNLSNNNLFS